MDFIGTSSHKKGMTIVLKKAATFMTLFCVVIIAAILRGEQTAFAQSTPVQAGYRDFSYATAVDEQPAGEKPESKLWWNDGFWWGSLWDANATTYSIHRFNVATQSWVNTGVAIDDRGQSKADVLWDETHLYVASHYYTLTPGPASSGQEARLYRYSYNVGTQTYSLDVNFPVVINNSISEILVLDKDSTGQLWITWTENGVVKINRSLGNDETWGTPFDLPVQGSNANVDDISSIVAFDGNKIGVMWSNRNDEKAYFAVHLDSDADTVWQPREEANADPTLGAVADDHINLKVACDGSGNLYAATKTRFMASESPHIYILRRIPDGTWSRHLFAKVKDGHTRPVVMVDDENGRLYVFATSDVNGKDEMFMKSADLNDLVFPAGVGTAFIQSATDLKVNNATSTKQCVNSETGLLVLADDHNSHNYLHNFIDLSSSGDPSIASFSPTSALVGTQVTISGSNFLGATGVYFNGTSAMTLIVDSESQIRTVVPSGASTGKITLATVGETTESANDFTVMQPPPAISSFTPGSGPEATEVTITGSNLLTTSDVKFNGTSATTITVDSDTQIRAKVPSGATTGVVNVTTDGGAVSSVDDFTFIASTSFTFSPTHDSYVRFSTATDNFGTVPTLRGRALGSDTLNAFLKFEVTGLVGDVLTAKLRLHVVNASADGGTVFPVSNNFLETGAPWTETGLQWVNAPTIGGSALSAVGSVAVSDVIEFNVTLAITGDGTYSFGLKNNSSDDVHYSSKEGANPPQLIIQTGTASIPAPSITSFTPTSGTENVEVTISGSNFTGAAVVKFNGTPASSFLVDSATQVRATVPTGASTGKISITTLGGVAFSAADFTFIPPAPVVDSFAPVSGIVGAEVTITGSNFNFATSVLFNGTAAASFTIDSATQIRAIVPSGATTGKITAQNSSGGNGLSASDFLVITAPSISSFAPESGITGVEVTIAGAGLSGVTAVQFNGVSATTFVVDSETQVRAELPTGASTGQINVTNAAGTAASTNDFTVVASTSTTFLPIHDAYVRFSTPLSNFATTITLRARTSSLDTLNSFLKFSVTGIAGTVQNAKLRMRVTNASNSGGSIYVATNNLNGSATSWTQTDLNWATTPQIIGEALSSSGVVAIDDVVDFNVTSAIVGNGTYSFALKSSSGDDVHYSSKEGANPPQLIIQTGTGLIPSPSITSFTPASGVVGTEVTISGSNLTGTSSVRFNGISATSFFVDSDTQIFADVPGGASTGKISVTTDGGAAESTNDFTVTVPAPGIASFSPTSGPAGTQVTIIGDDFNGATAVQFNGMAASSYTVDSSTQIRAAVPAGATTGKISVSTAGGTSQSTNDFTITIPPPTITLFTPTSGLVGAEVTITGSNLTGATPVQFNGSSASSFTVDNATQIRAIVPSGASTGKISATTAGGTVESANDFTVIISIPVITSFTPTSGNIGAEVTISGSNFPGATSVQFNATAAAAFTIDSATQIRATVPTGATTGVISVITPVGTGLSSVDFVVSSSGPATLTFAPAQDAYVRFSTPLSNFATAITLRGRTSSLDTLNSFLKFNVGGIAGTVLSAKLRLHVTNASNIGGAIYVASNNLPGAATPWAQADLNWNNAPQISGPALSSAGVATAGQWIEFNVLAAITGNGTYTFALKSSSTDDVHYSSNEGANPPQLEIQTSSGSIPAPLISSFSPGSGVVDTEVTIAGSNFTGATLVKFNGVSAPSFAVHSDSEIRADVPTGASSGAISVTTGGGTAMSATDFIVTVPPPAIGSFSPTSGTQGTVVTISGDNFNGSTAAQFNGLAASTFTIDSATQIRATVPAGATTGKIGVTTPGGAGLSVNDFTVNSVAGAPSITSFSPTSGLVITLVTITGANFNGTNSVKFNGTDAPTFVVDSNTQIRVSVPGGATTGKISVTNAASTAFSINDFVVIPPAPSIASFTPGSGLVGIEVTVTGNNFSGATAVQFNGVPASTFTVDSATQIRVTVPGAATTGTISVTTGGGTALSTTNFTVIPPAPIISSFSPSSGLVGIQVTIIGSNFSGASNVQFNGTTASTFIVDSATQIRVTVPVAATTGKINVTTLGGTALSAADFVMTPIITTFTPTTGVAGTEVTITGNHFIGATAIQFNSIAASTFTVDSAMQIRATAPANATTGKISVTTPGGTALSVADFAVSSPSITSFAPTSGLGGAEVTITGMNFNGASSVQFNGATATFTVDSNTQLRANVPAGATTGKISVTTGGGTAISADDFFMTPVITSFTPASGLVGDEVTITGNHFINASSVKFQDGTAPIFTVVSNTQIKATVPATATTGKISVTTADGTALSVTDFTILAPTITSFTPTSGSVGAEVTITGTNFSGVSSVKFNGTTATVFTVESPTQARANVPAGAITGKISVTTAGGTAMSAVDFAMTPIIASFTPASGVEGTEVTITGSHFTGATAAQFNNVAASTFTVDSATQIRAAVSGLATTGKISVTTLGGTAVSTTDFVFIPPAPIISSFTPLSGLMGTQATITGSNFANASSVKFNGVEAASFTLDSATQIRATLPIGAGTGKISVTTPGGPGLSATDFIVPAPTIASFSPPAALEGEQVIIAGANFTGTMSVAFNGVPASIFIVDSATQIRALVPNGATTGKIGVTTGGGTGSSADDFIFATLAPIITSFTPASGLAGTQVTITGSNFADVTGVTFNGTPASPFSIQTSTHILATLPVGATTGKIALTNPHGTTLSASDFFVGPIITSFTPSSGVVGIEVTITGNNFGGVTAVQFNGTAAATYTVDSSTQIRATVAAGSTAGQISVTTAVSTALSAANFTVIPPAPIIASFTPGSGLAGVEVTVIGSNFSGASDVKFNATSASTFTIDSATQIRATVPAGATSGKISVTTLGGTALSAADFTVILSAPIISSFSPSSGVVGIEVTISGSHLNGASEVKFNTTPASTFIVDSPVQIRVTVPVGATTEKISVTTGGGTGISSNDFIVTPPAPTITSFTPSSGQEGAEVTITGSNLMNATEIKFNGALASTFMIDSATQIRATVPASATSGKVSVTTGGGTVMSVADFTVLPPAPTIASFSPTSGVVGTEVTITGGNFSGASAVKFNATNAAFIIDTATQIRANVPSGAGLGKISVTTVGGTILSATDFTVTLTIPTITSFSPENGIVGSEVTITGANFTGAAEVKLNGTSATTFTVDFATQLRAIVPTGATTGKISVTTAGGTALSATDFTVTLLLPTIASFTPASGIVGSEVTIAGTNFASTTDVKFNTTSASVFTVDSATQIRANVPSGASIGKISVTTAGGAAISATDFTVTSPIPTIALFTPTSGLVGAEVAITGTNFTGATEVKFNSTTASIFTLDSATQIRATVPTGATTGKISVTTAGGTALSGSDFTVTVPSPAITSFSPASGLVGIQITITGSNFTGASNVMFNSMSASSFTVDSATQIRATVPAGATAGKISVTTLGGTALSATDFTVIPPSPVISSFSPSIGLVGTEVTISGNNFGGASDVKFNGVSALTFTIDSATQIRAFVPAAASSGKISVTTLGGATLSANDFSVSSGVPVTETVLPLYDSYVRLSTPTSNYGSVTALRLREGSGDKLNSYLKFNVTNVNGPVTSAKLRMSVIEASVNGGSVFIVSNNYRGTSTPWTQSGINWNNAPVVTGSPLSSMGPVSLGAIVEFDVTSAVTGNGIVSFALTTSSSDMAQYSSQEGSIKPELVIEYGGGALPVPSISSFAPSSGAAGVQVTIAGVNFGGASGVKFNGVSASSFSVDSAPQIRATVPAGATSGKISVTTAGGIATSIADFTVTTPPSSPTIASFTPASGIVGTEVTVTGANFSGATSVQLNGVFASTFTVDSNTQLRATVPASATTGKISVTTGAGAAISVNDFTVTGGVTFTERFVPLYDTYVRLATPTSNFGSTTAIRLRKSGADDLNSYLKFDVAGISGTVVSAKLRLKVLNASNDGAEIFAVSNFYKNTTTPWTQSGMNWNNAPVVTGSSLSTHGPVAIDEVAEFEVTAAITSNGTFSFGVSNNSSDDIHYSSQEGTTKPELLIEYSTGVLALPTITSFSPTSGAVGSQVTISGSNFTGATNVQFNGTFASTFTIDSANQLRASAPTGASTGKISVTTPGGTALSAGNFTVTAPPSAPTITSFTPSSGIVGTEVTIIGTNFTGASGVKFNATFASSFTVDSATQIRATVPSGATSGKVSVITAGGTAVSASDFTVSGGSTLTATIEPYHDAFVRQSTPTTVYGDNTSLRVRRNSTDKMYSFMKFHVTGISGSVVNAKIRLKVTNASVDGGSIYPVSNKYAGTSTEWLEDGINWNNAPLIPDTPLSSVGSVAIGAIVEFDVTAAIPGNGTYSFGMSNESSDDAHFISQEGAVHPQLVIQYSSTTIAKHGDGVDDLAENLLPEEYSLSQNYPNPFNGQTMIEYTLPEMAKVRLVIYNALGQIVRKLVDETQSAGYKHAAWDGRDERGESVGSSIYFYQLEAGQHRMNGRMILQQ